MLILQYWGLMLIHFFTVFWVFFAGTCAIDLTLIGHIKGWKRIRYHKWFGYLINKDRRYGYKLVNDQHTHPQVLWFLFGTFLIFACVIILIVMVWKIVNAVDAWILWFIDAVLYIPTISGLITLKVHTKHVYLSYLKNKNDYKSTTKDL